MEHKYEPNDPRWDHHPSETQLALHLLGVLINPHLWLDAARDHDLEDPLKVQVYQIDLAHELWLAILGELPPAVDAEPDDDPIVAWVATLELPEPNEVGARAR